MLKPEDIDNFTEIVGERYDKLQDLLMAEIMEKVNKGLASGGTVQWDVQKVLEIGGAWDKEILAKIQKTTGLAKKDVERLMRQAGYDSIREDNKRLPNNHQLPHKMTKEQLRIIMAGVNNVRGDIGNMANVSLDSTLHTYKELLSEGFTMMASGAFTLDQTVEHLGKTLVKEGVKGIEYASGRKDRIEVAVRRAMRTSTNQTMLKLGEQNALELGTDLVEVTAHSGARPSHAMWQGKVYSLSGKTRGYRKLSTATGYGTLLGLGGVNCRHNFFPFFPDASEKEYKPSELRSLADEKVMVDGKEISMYQATQQMRGLERKMRDQLRLEKFAKTDTKAKQVAIKQQIKSLEQQTGLRSNKGRYQIYGEGFSAPKTKPQRKAAVEAFKKNYNNSIGQKLGRDGYDLMESNIEKCPNKSLAKLWKVFEDGIDVNFSSSNNQFCMGSSQIIAINKNSFFKGDTSRGELYSNPTQVLFHEGSHGIDNMMSKKRGYKFSYSSNYKDGIFPQTIEREVNERVEALAKIIKNETNKHWDDPEWLWKYGLINDLDLRDWYVDPQIKYYAQKGFKYSKALAYDAFREEVTRMGMDEYANLSDILEGATNDRIHCGFGHGKTYWRDRMRVDASGNKVNVGLAKEAFAEMCDATLSAPKQLEAIKKYLPESYKIWEEMIEEALK